MSDGNDNNNNDDDDDDDNDNNDDDDWKSKYIFTSVSLLWLFIGFLIH